MIELNLLSGRIMVVHYKIVEIIRAAPRFFSEYLQVDYEQKTLLKWNRLVTRKVTVTSNFAFLPSLNEEEQHDKLAT